MTEAIEVEGLAKIYPPGERDGKPVLALDHKGPVKKRL